MQSLYELCTAQVSPHSDLPHSDLPYEVIKYIDKFNHKIKMKETFRIINRIKIIPSERTLGVSKFFDWEYCHPYICIIDLYFVKLQSKLWGHYKYSIVNYFTKDF